MSELQKDGLQLKSSGPRKDPLLGTVLNQRYEVLELVGSGAMGALYRGKHLALDRPVAIKLLRGDLTDSDKHMDRFAREAKAAAGLQHANVAHVYDVGNTDDGAPYLVMDYLDGRSLAAIIADLGPMPVKRALPLMKQIAAGLGYAHAQGLIHRDIKPSNIMVVPDSGSETVKIIDFGIAKAMDEHQSALTGTGEVFGSPLYMSPEQCQGHKLDSRSDIYSFGCVMYEMLTGVPPLKGDTLVSTVYKHMNEQPKAFAEAAPGINVPADLSAIVMKCLCKSPADRYASCTEIADALSRVTADAGPTPVADALVAAVGNSEHSLTPSEETGRKVRNNMLFVLAIPLLVAAVGTTYMVLHRPPAAEVAPPVATPTASQETYNGDDAHPYVWKNPAASSQNGTVLFAYTHQTSSQPRSKDINYEYPGAATVHVSAAAAAGKPVILVLGGFAPIKWTVSLDPGVALSKVIASGYLQQSVTGVPSGVPIIESSDSLPPNRAERTNKPFTPFSDLSSLSSPEDSSLTAARETIKRLADGNDVTELHATSQTHQVNF